MYLLTVVLGFIIMTSTFSFMHYEAQFEWIDKEGQTSTIVYELPALVGPNDWNLLTESKMEPLAELPANFNAARANTVIWSFIAGTILYILVRLITRKRISQMIQPLVAKINDDLLDEIAYRSVLIGFPIFTLGGLVFAMIWAQIAWTRFWTLGSKRGLGPYYLVFLCCFFTFTIIKRVAWRKICLACCNRIRYYYV